MATGRGAAGSPGSNPWLAPVRSGRGATPSKAFDSRDATDHHDPHGRLVAESWERARRRRLDPERLLPSLELPESDLGDYRRDHPLALLLPVVRTLLLADIEGSGLLVALGDERGRLLWVEGDHSAKRQAEGMRFVEGAGWAESRVGTSAPGTALVLDHGMQIRGSEHFNVFVQQWSCTAVPIHDPVTRRILGFLDITGDDRAVADHTLPLLQATAAAMESEMLVSRLRASRRTTPPHSRAARSKPSASATLSTLGRDTAMISDGRRIVSLTARHSEIITILSAHPRGIGAEELSALVYGDASAVTTLRAEMVRLRHALEVLDPRLAPLSRPYRLPNPLDTDIARVDALLDRGAHRQAVDAYSGQVLPGSAAPGVEDIRDGLATRLRESLLTGASVDVLLAFAERSGDDSDREILMAALGLLPARSPRRAGIVARLERLDRL
ncbi:GAF domain-containing protein [Frondihabitans sp. Leaf304]|uniref:GAF domain-containing protein n=1 Tax=Frondihabitans sp. Leaf304 TaxID=1736329 RepID=UPI000A49EF01|nr:GAF domain-containing protein [Frondihabitans sp. Leaf304]